MKRFSIGVPTIIAGVCSILLVGCPPVPLMEVTPPASLSFAPADDEQPLKVKNTTDGELTLNIEISAEPDAWLSVSDASFSLAQAEEKTVTVTLDYTKAYAYKEGEITVIAKTGEGEKEVVVEDLTTIINVTVGEYFTQKFAQSEDAAEDMQGKMVIFTVSDADSPTYYQAEYAELPEGADVNMRLNKANALAGTSHTLDEFVQSFGEGENVISLLASADAMYNVLFYGTPYGSILVGDDGRVSFGKAPAVAAAGTAAGHFATPGISALYKAFDPAGNVYAIDLGDRLAIIYKDFAGANSFQVELFYDSADTADEFAISWFAAEDEIDAIVGLSAGAPVYNDGDKDGVPDDFEFGDTDLLSNLTSVAVPNNTRPLTVAPW